MRMRSGYFADQSVSHGSIMLSMNNSPRDLALCILEQGSLCAVIDLDKIHKRLPQILANNRQTDSFMIICINPCAPLIDILQ